MKGAYGMPPILCGHFDVHLTEVMYYLYLPVRMQEHGIDIRLPPNLAPIRSLIGHAIGYNVDHFKYVYVSARKGWATPDNPLNRPGWHCDGFGTDDLNFVWWRGPGTRFAHQPFFDISADHVESLQQFDRQIVPDRIDTPPEAHLYGLTPSVVHATPIIKAPGCMRSYVKISLSNERYNLWGNSHNHLFDYDWPMVSRDDVRNDTHKAQADRG